MKNTKSINKKLQTTPIAIIGISSIFPQATNLKEYWDNILNKIDSIIDVPPSRWNSEDYYDANPSAADKVYCKRGGFIPDIDFDPVEFGLPPNILEATDVSQLLALVGARDCLEDGGYGHSSEMDRENVGVILGMVGIGSKLVIPLMARLQYPIWDKVLSSYGIAEQDRASIIEKIKLAYPKWEENSFPGSIGNVVAGRIANRFDLGGTNCTVDAACASSLAAIRMAVGELIEHRADMMLSGGVDTDNSIGTYMCFSKTPAFSKGDRVRSFDKDSDGMMVGEGIGMVLLKRLDDAKRDGDRVYAVIKGIGTSSDGRFKSIYAPRPDGQSLALRRAYNEAGFSPSTVDLIEAHGTGTMAGDPAEFEGLNNMFSEHDAQNQHIALGTVKSQIGHTKGAAGVASLIKVAMALHNKILPATINVKEPSPKLDIENTPFYLNTEIRPWLRPVDHPRRAGVSSFGFGGTNFHVVLEEAENDHSSAYRIQATAKMIILSAPTSEKLYTECLGWAETLNEETANYALNELAVISKNKIPQTNARIGFTAIDLAEAKSKLVIALDILKSKGTEDAVEHPAGVYFRKSGLEHKGKLVAIFPGQGSQYVNMGRETATNFPEVRQSFGAMDAHFTKDKKQPLSKTVYPIPVFSEAKKEEQNVALTSTELAQPAIGTLSVGFFKILQNSGFRPDFIAGHSFGELTALWAGGVFSEDDFYYLAKSRGKAMSPPSDPNFEAGTMLAVKGDIENLRLEITTFPEIVLANLNSNNQVVLAGSKPDIAAIQKVLIEKGYSVVALDVSAAFHTPLVAHAQKPFAEAINTINFKKPLVPVYSNSTGQQYAPDPKEIQKTLSDHILNPVKFKDEIKAIHAAGGTIFVEIGPKNILTNLVKNILEGKPHVAIALNPNTKKDSDRQLRDAITQLCVIGLELQNFDPYSVPDKPASTKKNSAATVKLNGGLFIAEKTKNAFQEALRKNESLQASTPTQKIVESKTVSSPETQNLPKGMQPQTTHTLPDLPSNAGSIQALQQETLRVHSQYLENDAEYTRLFSQITQQELTLIDGKSSNNSLEQINIALQTLDRSMAQFHQHQTETLRIHEEYLRNQTEMLNNLLGLSSYNPTKQDAPSPVRITTPVAGFTGAIESPSEKVSVQSVPTTRSNGHKQEPIQANTSPSGTEKNIIKSTTSINVEYLTTELLDIVSEKTGYPTEMLELEMDMEADLGIDSIKRVEILGAMQDRFPELPKADASALAEMRSLGQIVEYMSNSASGTPPTDQSESSSILKTPVSKLQDDTISDVENSDITLVEITTALLEIVSEKTGYPTEMLELEMDMEADLGIDSIKRVEILGAMQDRFPELPKADPSALAEMRTLGQITGSMSAVKIPEISPSNQTVKRNSHESAEMTTSLVESDTVLLTTSLDEVKSSLLDVVSEKTGYPTEMLELDMDMEADLGIDSIKRVEILGAMQEIYPELPKADTAALAEMRTLQQIIDSFTSPGSKASADLNKKLPSESSKTELIRGFVSLKSIPMPDFIEMKGKSNKTCLIVDNGNALTPVLVEKLTGLGNKVAVLTFPENTISAKSVLTDSVPSFELADLSDNSVQTLLKKISKDFGKIEIFIHLDPMKNGNKPFSENEKDIVKTIFLVAKHLKDDLTTAGKNGYAAFLTVTHLDGQFGLSLDNSVEPVSGGLFGLTKTLNLEWDDVFCRAIDILPEMSPEKAAECITTELFDPNLLISEVAYNKDGRFTLVVDLPEIAGLS